MRRCSTGLNMLHFSYMPLIPRFPLIHFLIYLFSQYILHFLIREIQIKTQHITSCLLERLSSKGQEMTDAEENLENSGAVTLENHKKFPQKSWKYNYNKVLKYHFWVFIQRKWNHYVKAISVFHKVRMFTAALFTTAGTWKQAQCPSTTDWIKKMWYIKTVEYYSAAKKEILPFENTWIDLESILLSWNKLHKERQIPYNPY